MLPSLIALSHSRDRLSISEPSEPPTNATANPPTEGALVTHTDNVERWAHYADKLLQDDQVLLKVWRPGPVLRPFISAGKAHAARFLRKLQDSSETKYLFDVKVRLRIGLIVTIKVTSTINQAKEYEVEMIFIKR